MKPNSVSFLLRLLLAAAIAAPLSAQPSHSSAAPLFTLYLPLLSRPDTGRIAYVACPLFGYCYLEVINADGTNRMRLTGNEFFQPSSPAWSPDGRQLIFAASSAGPPYAYAIYRIDADGRNPTRLIDLPESDASLSWSHDGSRIAFSTQGDIYVAQADGSSLVQLTSNAGGNGFPDWSPDDQLIAFTSDRSGRPGLYVMNADGSDQHLIGNASVPDSQPAWSPDGSQIAFTRWLTIFTNGIFVMDADGTHERPVIVLEVGSGDPAWSPDGRRLVFESSSMMSRSSDIGIISLDGTDLRWIAGGYSPAWTP